MKLINVIKSLSLVLVIASAASCVSSVKVTSDYSNTTDFSKYKTFSVYEIVTTLNVNQFNTERIVNAIRTEMIKKGFKETNKNPDLAIGAVTVIKDKQSITASGNGGWYRPYRNLDIQTNKYKEGTLVVQVVDVKEENLVWEGTAYSEFDKRPKNPEKTINDVVSRIMKGFPSNQPNNNHSTM